MAHLFAALSLPASSGFLGPLPQMHRPLSGRRASVATAKSMSASSTAKANRLRGLTAADFTVREDNVVREVLEAGPATEPLTIAVTIDDSQAANSRDPVHPRCD